MKKDDTIEKCCKYCELAQSLSDPDCMVCKRSGVVPAGHSCRRFRYDPLKRAPKLNTNTPKLEYVEI